jgi:hypothetical protein
MVESLSMRRQASDSFLHETLSLFPKVGERKEKGEVDVQVGQFRKRV